MNQPQQQKEEALKYVFSNVCSSVVKFFQVMAPEVQKFDESLKKISVEADKIRNQKTTKSKSKSKQPKQPGKPELKVLS